MLSNAIEDSACVRKTAPYRSDQMSREWKRMWRTVVINVGLRNSKRLCKSAHVLSVCLTIAAKTKRALAQRHPATLNNGSSSLSFSSYSGSLHTHPRGIPLHRPWPAGLTIPVLRHKHIGVSRTLQAVP
ncbi:hypothetical protein BAUCODRAFT_174945 [Baudoinia panamericana UAMH 10762]|uniref:Uncharacterized protein n=1 Tax=Baudoinia panamericana (strain UAMH 10762) TaxID=717646 RepID=M2N8W9_BAUPA|nr:uncharacterized protein BAUCODRAFT_174945 [Baudoinia panamericana UAMH 10762]EMD00594.1 hypothetical protein BAUCODRAFT_174945 [Baudoinia panamericana UAMH 10762]